MTFYLLHAFTKKSQKTPAKELKIALDRMKEVI
ncbi:MAG: type II toxin-antitoxin system RelE/ParE family toxin [bacterium]